MLEHILQHALGSLTLGRERIEERLRALVEGGFLSAEEARALVDRVMQELARRRRDLEEAQGGALGAAAGFVSRALDLPTRADIAELKERLAALEAELRKARPARRKRVDEAEG